MVAYSRAGSKGMVRRNHLSSLSLTLSVNQAQAHPRLSSSFSLCQTQTLTVTLAVTLTLTLVLTLTKTLTKALTLTPTLAPTQF